MELVTSAQIAERLGLAWPEQVHALRTRNADFPEPRHVFGKTMAWSWAEVRKWSIKHDRLDADGRPTNPRRTK